MGRLHTLAFVLWLAPGSLLAAPTAPARDGAPDLRPSRPDPAPAELRTAWLRFHELELCQSVDAVFAFQPRAVDVWCVVEDDKSYQKLLELLEPLRGAFEVTVFPTRVKAEKKSPEDKDPPPSIWNNAEVRAHLQDPFGRLGGGTGIRAGGGLEGRGPDSESFLKQRMLLFAEQTLDWGRRMKRCAADLPELSAVAFGYAGESPEVRARATAVALAHAQAVGHYADKLGDNLRNALPAPARRSRAPDDRGGVLHSPADGALEVASAARNIARRVYRFIHPQSHTVGLVDLRDPNLLELLKTLRRMTTGYEHAAGLAVRR
jgi:hypothetical protein